MGRNPKIKIKHYSEKDLEKMTACNKCGFILKFRHLLFYVDESNISITENSKGICTVCANLKKISGVV